MPSCLDIASYFIAKSYEDGRESIMTNMKVQKLLYYSQCLHLTLQDEPLFPEEIQAWRYGPVCPPAYHLFSQFEAEQLPIPTQADRPEILSQEQRDLLEEVWLYFGEYNAYYLSGMTHLEFPWKKARKGLPAQAASREPIQLSDMKLLGEQKLDEIERDHPAYMPILAGLLRNTFPVASAGRPAQYVQPGGVRDWLTALLN
jgi:uncharacterized phage-associated protein